MFSNLTEEKKLLDKILQCLMSLCINSISLLSMVIYWLIRSSPNFFFFLLKHYIKYFSYQSAWSLGSKDTSTLSRSEIQSPIIYKFSNIWTCWNQKTSSKMFGKITRGYISDPLRVEIQPKQEYALLLKVQS